MIDNDILIMISMSMSFAVGLSLVPLAVITYITALKFYRANRNRKVDEKRRKTFKIVQGSKK